ncbi:MAG: cytochrome c [Caulobacteraceae bacterium]
MKHFALSLAGLGTALALVAGGLEAQAQSKPAAKDTPAVAHGRAIWVSYGCYQCHGYQGQGGAAPRLAPNPLPLDAFAQQLRHPRARMPIYTAVTVSDADLNDLYAYAQSIPKTTKTAADIPLLNQ